MIISFQQMTLKRFFLIYSWENQEAIDVHHASPMMDTQLNFDKNTTYT